MQDEEELDACAAFRVNFAMIMCGLYADVPLQ
jgi:hypothetical protein